MATGVTKVYEKIWLSDFFHSFFHVNFHFESVSSTFDPENQDYQEAILFLALIPVALCILLWPIFLVYFWVQCCCKRPSVTHTAKDYNSGASKVILTLLILLGLCLTGFGFYENESTHSSVHQVDQSVVNINTTITSASNTIAQLDTLADDISNNLAVSMEAMVSEIPDQSLKAKLLDMINEIIQEATTFKSSVDVVDEIEDGQDDLTEFHDIMDEVEYYRWVGTVCVMVVYLLQFLTMLLGMYKHLRCLLITNAVFGVLLAVAYYAVSGVYFGSSVAFGDFCVDPTGYFESQLENSTGGDTLEAYLRCEDPILPYQTIILEAQASITKASSTINNIYQDTSKYNITGLNATIVMMEYDLQMAFGNMSSLLSSVGQCPTLHNYYIDAVTYTCVDTFTGLALLLITTAALALVCTLILFVIPCVWRQYNKRTVQLVVSRDETDPFLPRPPPYESDYGAISRTASPRAWSERTALQAQYPPLPAEEQVMVLRHQQTVMARNESPPPAYHSGQYTTQEVEEALSSNYGRPRNQ